MSDQSRRFPHIYLPENGESENYTRPGQGGGGSPPPPERDRVAHAQALEQAIGLAIQEARQQLSSRDPDVAAGVPGFYLEFQVQADKANAFEQLENRQRKIELVAVNQKVDVDMVTATVFVPASATDHFSKKVEKYRDEDDSTSGKPKNEKLVSRIETVQIGTVRSLFTDDPNLFPDNEQEVWWEVWLRNERRSVFDQVIQRLNIRTKPHIITFPEREIVLVMSNAEAMAQIIKNSDAVAELRIAKDIPSMFLEMGVLEQANWAKDLAERLIEPGQHAVAISMLEDV